MKIYNKIYILFVFLFLDISPQAVQSQETRLAQPLFLPPSYILFSTESRDGLFLFNENDKSITTISDKKGSGRYFIVSEENNLIGYKEISYEKDIPFQRVCFYNPLLRKRVFQSEWCPLCGNPSLSSNGKRVFSIGKRMIILDGTKMKELDIGFYANLSPISHNGNFLVFNDENDQLWVIDIYSKIKKKITDYKLGYWNPSWSTDDKKIVFSSLGGEIFVYYVDKDSLNHIGEGLNPRWLNNSHLIYVKQEIEHYRLINSDIVIYNINKGNGIVFETPEELEIEPAVYNNRLFYVSFIDGGIYEAKTKNGKITKKKKMLDRMAVHYERKPCVEESRGDIILNIPYLHQVYDTKNEFDGRWACGPTSCVMAVQTYNKLPNWGTLCSSPYEHMSLFGRYISDIYTYNGITYDWLSYDPSGNPAYGAYGYICPSGGAVWANMKQYIVWHNINSFMDTSPTWSEFLQEIDNGYPVVVSTQLTSAGHIILGKGYVEGEHTLISNDPYGNKNSGYPNYYGSGAFYDWPGYNNGYENLNNVKVFIGAEYNFPQEVKIYDDLDTIFSFTGNWLERTGGYDMHSYYTDAAIQGDSAFWKIHITQPDTISLYTEFYRGGDRVKNAHYFIRHKDGSTEVNVDQRGYGLSGWYELGIYYFEDSIIIGTTDTGSDSIGIVLADAVMLVFHNATGIKKAEERKEKREKRGQLKIFPNPFREKTSIRLTVNGSQFTDKNCQLQIYNVSGRLVKSFSLPTAYSLLPTEITWDGRDNSGKEVPPGLYFIKIRDQSQSVLRIGAKE